MPTRAPEPDGAPRVHALPHAVRAAVRDGAAGDDRAARMLAERAGAAAPGRRRSAPARPITVGRVVKWLGARRSSAGSRCRSCCSCSPRSSCRTRSSDAPPRRSSPAAASPIARRTTVLVLGSDQRTAGTKEPGASTIGPEPLGLDPADARRRRPQREALDPARHGRRHPRPRAEQDQRRLRDRRLGARGPDRQAVPRDRRSTTSSRSTSRTSRS